MSSLYELTEEMVALDRLLAELGGEVTEGTEGQTLEQWATEFDWKLREKVDGYGSLIKNLEADAGAIGEEVKRLQDRARVLDNRASRLKALAKFSMERLQTRKLEGLRFTIALQKAGGLAPLEVLMDAEKLPEHFQTVTISANNEAIRKQLENPDTAEAIVAAGIARLGERGEYVRIR